jgi:hypothetical protein
MFPLRSPLKFRFCTQFGAAEAGGVVTDGGGGGGAGASGNEPQPI